ncbi:uncharacterized protein EAF01_011990 [Botrytis porri]|uniref:Uncharacterized protein n=1 Tax=Botrytis porri TaxID=87229 RepID=A0A4Z1KQ50_9HELO|nr:uncharacterized protein EAF01_011990 [Botrytis porri]KAF7880721.1 hypothetical protein EAF01_011990 [Botrytis porri]TGO87718.1 hypothetical protein BPOR_0208g00060 [Botrytis porri]
MSISASDSYMHASSHTQDDELHELDSLPSSVNSSDYASSDDGEESDAQKEWEASLQQLEMMLTMVIVPWCGKYFGRKFAYWSWAKYMTWKYPVTVEITSNPTFKGAGAIEAAATL